MQSLKKWLGMGGGEKKEVEQAQQGAEQERDPSGDFYDFGAHWERLCNTFDEEFDPNNKTATSDVYAEAKRRYNTCVFPN